MTLEITNLATLRKTIDGWRAKGETIALVPTMGALHRGHMTLMLDAKEYADRVVASIFVNPTQFGPTEDFSKYPRTTAEDVALLKTDGIDAVWLPDVPTMYPQGFATTIHITGITETLEGPLRPGHFDGVATVVAKLFQQVQPDTVLFGEKDYQQLKLIERMVSDLNMNLKVLGTPTVREEDGLALSSRNRYLSPEDRRLAPQLHEALQQASRAMSQGKDVQSVLAEFRERLTDRGFALDYLELRHAETLMPLTSFQKPARLLVAAKLGTTRLIDNIAVE